MTEPDFGVSYDTCGFLVLFLIKADVFSMVCFVFSMVIRELEFRLEENTFCTIPLRGIVEPLQHYITSLILQAKYLLLVKQYRWLCLASVIA